MSGRETALEEKLRLRPEGDEAFLERALAPSLAAGSHAEVEERPTDNDLVLSLAAEAYKVHAELVASDEELVDRVVFLGGDNDGHVGTLCAEQDLERGHGRVRLACSGGALNYGELLRYHALEGL